MPASPVSVTVDLTHDVVCPWCRIGHHNLMQALRGWTGPAVQVRLHPFLLNPDAPPQGLDLRQYIAKKYGGANVDAMFARVTQVGAQYGVTFAFDKVRVIADTVPAHALVLAAPADRQQAVLEAIHLAHFEQGANPGDRQVLLAAWQTAGLDRATGERVLDDVPGSQQVRQAALAAANSGIGGVPHFEFTGPAGRATVHGGQAPAALLAALKQVGG